MAAHIIPFPKPKELISSRGIDTELLELARLVAARTHRKGKVCTVEQALEKCRVALIRYDAGPWG